MTLSCMLNPEIITDPMYSVAKSVRARARSRVDHTRASVVAHEADPTRGILSGRPRDGDGCEGKKKPRGGPHGRTIVDARGTRNFIAFS